MQFAESKKQLIDFLPEVKGSYREFADIGKNTWFQVGGLAEVLFKPEDAEDIAILLKAAGGKIPYTVIGVGSNLLVRDGGVDGVVIRLGRGFTNIRGIGDWGLGIGEKATASLKIGAGCLNNNVAQYCVQHGIGGLEFLSGIPGTIGGALAMNAGAYGREVKDVLITAKLVDKDGNIKEVSAEEIGYRYRGRENFHGAVFVEGTFRAEKSSNSEVEKAVREIQKAREETQPIRNKTGGSTFKNPYPHKAWELIDKAGCRGLRLGGAMVSEKHCNFLINTGDATAVDIENLGELVREKVLAATGVQLEWEIQRIGNSGYK